MSKWVSWTYKLNGMTYGFIFLFENILTLLSCVHIKNYEPFFNWILGELFFFVYFTLPIPTWSSKDGLDTSNHQVFILLGNCKITYGVNRWYGMNLSRTMSLVHTLIWQLINWHFESRFLPWSTPNCLIPIQPSNEH